MGTNIVTDILNTMFAGLSQAATSIPSALGDAIVGFMTTTVEGTTHLSDAGQIVVVFAGISLA